MPRRWLVTVACACWLAMSLLPVPTRGQEQEETIRRDQDVQAAKVVDYGYLFSLERPGKTWKLMGEQEIRSINPDAVAGALDPAARLGLLVFVEQAPGTSAAGMAQLIMEGLALEDKETERLEESRLDGQSAMRFVVRGTSSGIKQRFCGLVAVHRGHLYQFLGWGPQSKVADDGSSFEAIWPRFRFLPGEAVPGRGSVRQVQDTAGVGWIVRDGRFSSAASGLCVEPAGAGWRLALGDELARMNAAAEVGIIHESPDFYMVLTSERAAGVPRSEFEAGLRASFDEAMEVPAEDSFQATVAGQEVSVTLRTVDQGARFDYAHTVVFHEEFAFQVLGWWYHAVRDAARPLLLQALGQIRFLEAAGRQEVGLALEQRPDPQHRVGPDYVVRRGLFRDFEFSYLWRKPAGYWRILVGQDARAQNESARLFVEEVALGLQGLVIAERAEGSDGDALHATVLENMLPEGDPALGTEPARQTIHETEFLVSWADLKVEDLDLRYLVATAVRGDTLYQFILWGLPRNMDTGRPSALAALENLDLSPKKMRPLELRPLASRDLRLGFELRTPGAGWTSKDITPKDCRPIGTILLWTRQGNQVVISAVCPNSDSLDASWFEQFIEGQMLSAFQKRGSVRFGDQEAIVLQGVPASRRRGEDASRHRRVDLVVAQRDRAFYGLMVETELGEGALDLEQLLAGFRWID